VTGDFVSEALVRATPIDPAKSFPRSQAAELTFRYEKRADREFVDKLYASTRFSELAGLAWGEAQKLTFLKQQSDAQHRHYREHYPDAVWWIICAGTEPVGRLYLEEWSSELRIIDIALLPDSRGNGLGSAILQDIIELAATKSKAVGIHVEKNNPAMKLYQRLGFSKTEDKGVYDLLHWHGAAPDVQANTAS